jgi:hypothetical protein
MAQKGQATVEKGRAAWKKAMDKRAPMLEA